MILLDTHALVWLASSPERLSAPARDLIGRHPSRLHVSIVSAWEISLLVKRGRLELPVSPEIFVDRAAAHHGLKEIPLQRAVAQRAVSLPDIHSDPFDRILVAECLERGLTLISCDRIIPTYPDVRVCW